MAGGGFQKGLPTRAEAIEGGNFVPVDITGPGRTRPILRDNFIEGLYAWRPDGTQGIYCGFNTDVPVPPPGPAGAVNGLPKVLLYNPATLTFADITPPTDALGRSLTAWTTRIEFLAIKFQPFYCTGAGGYLAYILVRSSVLAGGVLINPSTQIWVVNCGTAPVTISDPYGAPILIPAQGMVTHFFYVRILPLPGTWTPIEDVVPSRAVDTFRDLAFSWAGVPGAAAVDQIPFGIIAGDGTQSLTPTFANMYCMAFFDSTSVVPGGLEVRLAPTPFLWEIQTALPVTVGSKVTKITVFRKSFALLGYNTTTFLNQVWESVNDTAFVAELGPPTTFGKIDSIAFTEIRASPPLDLRRFSPYGLPPAGDPPTYRPEYTDITWTQNRNGLMIVGRQGLLISVDNPKWIFADPVMDTTKYRITQDVYPNTTTVHTGIEISPDGLGFILTSKTYNQQPGPLAVTLESVSDAFVKNLVTYYTSPIGYQTYTPNESRVSGFPFGRLNEFGMEHYRFAWHPFSRYCLFSVFGGFEKFDQEVFADIGAVNATVTVPQPLNVRIQDGDGATLADVITDGLGVNRLAVDAAISVTSTPATPVFTEAPQQVVEAEVNLTDSYVEDATSGDIPDLFDKDSTTEVVFDGVDDYQGAYVQLKSPLLIARVSVLGGTNGMRPDAIIFVVDIQGNFHLVYDGSNLPADVLVNGIDSQNFKDPANGPMGGPMSPIMAVAVGVLTTLAFPATWDMSEIVILKAVETKAFAYNEPSQPVFTESDQHVCLDEIWWAHAVIGDPHVGSPQSMFDKNPTTSFVLHDGASVYLPFNTPQMLSRVALVTASGVCLHLTVRIHDMAGGYVSLVTDLTTSNGWESHFERRMVTGITLLTDVSGGYADISDLILLKSEETPVVVEVPNQVLFTEVNSESSTFATGGTSSWTDPILERLFDRMSWPGVGFTYGDTDGVIDIEFWASQLISRVGLIGTGFPIGTTIEIKDIYDNWTTWYTSVGLLDGADTGDKSAILAKGVKITFPDDLTFLAEVCIFKTIETSTNINLTPPTPTLPYFVEAPQQVVYVELDHYESELIGSAIGTVFDIFDKNIATEAAFAGTAVGEGASIVFSTPLLIARVSALGGTLGMRKDVVIEVTDVEGNTHMVYNGLNQPPTLVEGVDSYNFKDQPANEPHYAPTSPIMAQKVTVLSVWGDTEFPLPWDISELVILKAIETKAFAYNEPSQPVFSESDQHVCLDEIWWENAIVIGPTNNSPKVMFDKNPNTYFQLGHASSIYLPFNTPQMISRVAFAGQCLAGTFVSIRDMNNFDVNLASNLATTPGPPPNGWESHFERRMIKGITISCDGSGSADINDLIILKSFESPVIVQVPNQILFTEVNSEENNSYFQTSGTSAWTNSEGGLPVLERLFDRMSWPGVDFVYDTDPGTLVITFWIPQLIDRVALAAGSIPSGTIVQAIDIYGNPITWLTTTSAEPGLDTGNMEPVMAQGVKFTFPDDVVYLCEVDILKVIETKASASRIADVPILYVDAEDIDEDEIIGPTGIVIPPPSNFATHGVLIERNNNRAVGVELEITGSDDETEINADVLWFYSDDDANYYYFATTQIRESPATGNPSGYELAGGTANRQLAHPESAFNKYIGVAVRNNDVETITVTVKIVKQR